MLEGNLNTTNMLLGIMAAVSVLQALVVVGVGVMAFQLYRQTLKAIRDIEQRQIAPLAASVAGLLGRVDGILADVKDVTSRVNRGTERLDAAVQDTMHSVDDTAGRVYDSVESRVVRIARLAYGVTSAMQSLFRRRRSGGTPAS
jgi:methyl-accepting chemotaxis protein